MKYKITVEQITEYPEMETVYESKTGGTRYYSAYAKEITDGKKGVDYVVKKYSTGRMLTRSDEIYTQHFDANVISKIIQAVNNI